MCLPPAYSSWTKKGRANQHRVRTRWGKQGRVNLIGTLSLEGRFESLEYRMLEGPCRTTAEVMDYLLDALAKEAEREGKPVSWWWCWTGRRPSTEQARCARGGRGGRVRG